MTLLTEWFILAPLSLSLSLSFRSDLWVLHISPHGFALSPSSIICDEVSPSSRQLERKKPWWPKNLSLLDWVKYVRRPVYYCLSCLYSGHFSLIRTLTVAQSTAALNKYTQALLWKPIMTHFSTLALPVISDWLWRKGKTQRERSG